MKDYRISTAEAMLTLHSQPHRTDSWMVDHSWAWTSEICRPTTLKVSISLNRVPAVPGVPSSASPTVQEAKSPGQDGTEDAPDACPAVRALSNPSILSFV